MAERSLYLDEGPGETRAVVALDGAPERLFLERAGEPYPRLGARYAARVARVDRALGLGWLDLGEDGEAALRLKGDRPIPPEGRKLEIEIAIEPQPGKPAVARLLGEAEGAPRRLQAAPDLEARLSALAPDVRIITGRAARDMADEAEADALAVEHALPGGGSIAIEHTRALTAVDVDLGAASGDAKRATRQTNLRAIAVLARLLRLKAQGGLVVIDLAGRGHDGQALTLAFRQAFAPDQPGVAFGPVSRFGLVELSLPRRWRPVSHILCGDGSTLSADSSALRLLRMIEREAWADPGGRIVGSACPEVTAKAAAIAPALAQRIGARFDLSPMAQWPPGRLEARSA